MRLLLAFEEEYRVYRDVTVGVIRVLRPHVEVSIAVLEELGERIEAFDPHLVICARTNSTDPDGRAAWIELSVDPLQPTKICVGGHRSEQTNPSVEALIAVLDEAEALVEAGEDPGGC
jgi:hypothetical protein